MDKREHLGWAQADFGTWNPTIFTAFHVFIRRFSYRRRIAEDRFTICRFFGLNTGLAERQEIDSRCRAKKYGSLQVVTDNQSPKSAQCDARRRAFPQTSDIHGRDSIAPAAVVLAAVVLAAIRPGCLPATTKEGLAEEN